jgi:hypothetical protein
MVGLVDLRVAKERVSADNVGQQAVPRVIRLSWKHAKLIGWTS